MNFGTVYWLHQGIGDAIPLYMLIMGVLSFINYARGRGVDGGIIGAVIIGELMIITQATLGIIMLSTLGGLEQRAIHILYGCLAVIFLPGLWVYTRGEMDRRASLIWGVAGFFMETHPDPAQALSDGPNAWPLDKMKELLETLLSIDTSVKQHGYQEAEFGLGVPESATNRASQ